MPKKAWLMLLGSILLLITCLTYLLFFHNFLLLNILSTYVVILVFDALFFRAFNLWKAKKYAKKSKKPMLNAGSGMFGFGDVNVDIKNFDVPRFVKANVENMHMFDDKQFSSVYASHILEHVENPKKAIKEFHRVGEKVFIVKPHFYSILAWIFPGHKWLFFKSKKIRLRN